MKWPSEESKVSLVVVVMILYDILQVMYEFSCNVAGVGPLLNFWTNFFQRLYYVLLMYLSIIICIGITKLRTRYIFFTFSFFFSNYWILCVDMYHLYTVCQFWKLVHLNTYYLDTYLLHMSYSTKQIPQYRQLNFIYKKRNLILLWFPHMKWLLPTYLCKPLTLIQSVVYTMICSTVGCPKWYTEPKL